EHVAVQRETKARTLLLQSLPEDHMADAREIWLAVKARFGGNEESKKMRKPILKHAFSEFIMSEEKGLHKGYDRFQKILSQLNQMQAKPDNDDMNIKFLRALPPSWSQVALTLKTREGLEYLSFDDLYNKLRSLEIDVKGGSSYGSRSTTVAPTHSAFIGAASTNTTMVYSDQPIYSFSISYTHVPSGSIMEDVLHSFVAENKPTQQLAYENFKQVDQLKMEELDIKWQMAMLSLRINTKSHLIKDCNVHDTVDKFPSVVSKAAYVPAGSRNSSASISAGRSIPAASRNGSASISAGRSIHAASRNGSASIHAGRSIPTASRNKPTSIHAGKHIPAGRINKPAPFPAGSSVPTGWTNPAARSFFRPTNLYFDNVHPHVNKDIGIVDSGCSRSMTGNKDKLDDFVQVKGGTVTFRGGDGKITGRGTIRTSKLNFKNVYYVEELQNFNLFFVSQICDKKNKVLFTDAECLPEHHINCLLAKAFLEESTKWHRRMAHVNFKTINKLAKHGLVDGLPLKLFTNEHNCVACNKRKQHKASYKAISAVRTISEPLQLLHMDLFGPTSIRKNQLNKKVKAIRCDNGTKFKNAKLIALCGEKGIKRDYSNARTPQQNRVAERKNKTLIEAARSMLADSKLPTMFWTEAVSTTCYVLNRVSITNPYNKTPYELLSGKVPNIRHLKPFGCQVTILNTSDHLGKFEGKANDSFLLGYAAHSTHDTNIIAGTQADDSESECDEQVILVPSFPSNSFSGPMVYDVSTPMKHNLDYAEELARLQRQEYEAHFAAAKHGFEFFDTTALLPQAEIEIRKNLVPAVGDPTGSIVPTGGVPAGSVPAGSVPASGVPTGSVPASSVSAGGVLDGSIVLVGSVPASSVPAGGVLAGSIVSAEFGDPAASAHVPAFLTTAPAATSPLPHGHSLGSCEHTTRFPSPSDLGNHQPTAGIFSSSSYDDDFCADVTNLALNVAVDLVATKRVNIIHPQSQIIGALQSPVHTRSTVQKSKFGESAFLSYVHNQNRTNHADHLHCLFACFLSQLEPSSVAKALEDPNWVAAMQEEMQQFYNQQVWKLVPLPVGKIAIGTKWILKNKRDARGIVAFAPVARIEAIRLFLAFASYMGFMVYQMDVKSAFLYGEIEEDVYVTQPKGFEDLHNPKHVYRVFKALYGLHQAPKVWYARLSTFLLKHHYRRGEFEMSAMGELTFFLGLQVKQLHDRIFISQDKYVKDMLKKFDMESVRPAHTPYEVPKHKSKDDLDDAINVHLFRSMIGSLMYLTASRPDIMFAVSACSRHQVTPLTSHLNAVKKIFKYLKGQPNLGLWYPRDSTFQLEAYSDSDYARSHGDRKSTTSGCQILGRRLISWQCKKQTVVATSSTESEYVAAASCCGQVFVYIIPYFLSILFCRMNAVSCGLLLYFVSNVSGYPKLQVVQLYYSYWSLLVRADDLVPAGSCIVPTGPSNIIATIDGNEVVVTESLIRTQLQLDDVNGLYEFTLHDVLDGMWDLWYPTDGSLTFYKAKLSPQWRFILDGMIGNIGSKRHKFLMHPCFLQMILGIQTTDPSPRPTFDFTAKLFSNMKLNWDGPHMLLLAPMLVVPAAGDGADAVAAGAAAAHDVSPPTIVPPPHFTPEPFSAPQVTHVREPTPVRDPTPMRDPTPVREPTPSPVREPTPDSPRPHSPPPRTEEVGPTTSTSPTRHTSVHEDISEGGGDFVSSPQSNEAPQTPAATPAGGAEDSATLTALSLKLDRCLHRVSTLENELGITKKVLGGAVLKKRIRLKRDKFEQNRIKTRQKREACRSQEKFKAVAVERGRKTKENAKRMVENAYTVKELFKFKEKKKRQGPKLHFFQSTTTGT
nr:hypothetical protein [Tanacetum cinerariifolium]